MKKVLEAPVAAMEVITVVLALVSGVFKLIKSKGPAHRTSSLDNASRKLAFKGYLLLSRNKTKIIIKCRRGNREDASQTSSNKCWRVINR